MAGALFGLLVAAACTLPTSSAAEPAAGSRDAGEYGARGDDDVDDTAALQRAFDALRPGDVLRLPPGTYLHADVLTVHVPDTRIVGAGARLTATREERSAFRIDADRVTVEQLTFAASHTTRRWFAYEQMKVRIAGHTGVVLRDVTVEGSAAAGIHVGDGAQEFRIERPVVRDTRADGIHMTGGASGGTVIAPTTERTGDDGVAVVSYGTDARPCRSITVTAPRVLATTWGRGVSVVGGEDVTYTDVDIRDTNAAAVYVGVEGDPYNTMPVRRVQVRGGRLQGANQNATIDHGAIVVHLGRPQHEVSDVRIEDLLIVDTRVSASSTITVNSTFELPRNLTFNRIRADGGPARLYGGNVGARSYSVTG